MYDGFTEEGYAFTLVGARHNIRRLLANENLEVYEHKNINRCDACANQYNKDTGTYDFYQGRGYTVFFLTGTIIHSPLLFCPDHFTTLHDMFVGLEMNDFEADECEEEVQ